ncbi:MAG: gamma-glutamyltransferase family protein, partial [Alphaproteobacteria bacterium]|nr:gamma-glutamyltransferase family protein [Alphaproteobacteria bacterium]
MGDPSPGEARHTSQHGKDRSTHRLPDCLTGASRRQWATMPSPAVVRRLIGFVAGASLSLFPGLFAAAEPARPAVFAQRHMVAAAHPLAAQAGLVILRRGGNAIDAAIAVALALNVVEPQAAGIGGGAFLVFYDAAAKRTTTFDGRETAPASATPDMFLNATGEPIRFADAILGGRAVGVPGLLRLMALVHQQHGRLAWADLFGPAIELAENGFPVSPRLAAATARERSLGTFEAARRYLLRDDGTPLQEGDRLTNRTLAETFRLVARDGIAAFYEGVIAGDIVAAVQGSDPNPGRLDASDLARYTAREREAVCGTYRRRTICGMGPPSSGGITTLQILGMLGRFDFDRQAPLAFDAVHLFAEASRFAFADRDAYIADPDFVDVPVGGLVNDTYLRQRSRLIRTKRAGKTAAPGEPPFRRGALPSPDEPSELPATSHLSIVDGSGNAVAMTASIESAFGSRL